MAMGSNELIQRGYAKLTTCLDDILEELGDVGEKMRPEPLVAAGASPAGDGNESAPAPSPRPLPKLSEAEKRVYEAVIYEPMFQDAVLRASQLPPGEVLAAFTSLELKGLIKRLPGQLVVRTGHA